MNPTELRAELEPVKYTYWLEILSNIKLNKLKTS